MKELRIFGICICVLLGTVMGNAASKLPSSVTMSSSKRITSKKWMM